MTFSGGVQSDFLKLTEFPDIKKQALVDFQSTDFVSLRQSLVDYIKAVYPDEYNYFIESDLGMMFIELVSYMGAVLSMKADILTNENFLSTAIQRKSVKKLLELIGVRMRGPLSAAAQAKLTLSPVEYPLGVVPLGAKGRTIELTSPEDGGNVTFTLYKVVNGFVDALVEGYEDILFLYPTEAVDSSSTGVFTNLVLKEGILVKEQGDFAATEGVKTIKLSQGPVIEGSIQVFIKDTQENSTGNFREVDNLFFASGTTDKIFETVYDDDYNATLVFGNNIAGVSPTNAASFTVLYRVGGGTRGNIAKDTINKTLNIPLTDTQVTITNTSKATGGANAETVEKAKKFAPLTFRRQDRLVTLLDYTVFANTFVSPFGTVGKATAVTRKAYSSANTIDIYILEKASDLQLQKASPTFKKQLLEAINDKKMATDEVVIVDGLIRTLDLVTTIRVDEEQRGNEEQIKAKVRNSILNYMNVDNRDFGESLIISELNRKIFEVDEVRYSTIDSIDQNIVIDFNEIIQLNNLTINVQYLD